MALEGWSFPRTRPYHETIPRFRMAHGGNLAHTECIFHLGGIFLVLTLFGIYMAMRYALTEPTPHQRDLVLLLLATISMAGGLLAAVQIYWIRYSLPLIPFVCIWIAYSLKSLFASRSPG